MDEFTVIGAGGKPKPDPSPSPCSPAAASVVTAGEGKCYRIPFEWLAWYDPVSLATHWRSLGFIVHSATGRRNIIPSNARSSVNSALSLLTSVAAIVGLLQVLPPLRAHRVVLRLSRLWWLHRQRSSPCLRWLWGLHLPRLDSRPWWRRVMDRLLVG